MAGDGLHINDQDLWPEVLDEGGSFVSVSGKTEDDRVLVEALDLAFKFPVPCDEENRCAPSLETLVINAVLARALTELFGVPDVALQSCHEKAPGSLNPVDHAVPA